MTQLSTIPSRNQTSAYRKPPDGKTASWMAGNSTFVIASIAVICVVTLTVFTAEVSMAVDEGYYFVLRQVSTVWDLVS